MVNARASLALKLLCIMYTDLFFASELHTLESEINHADIASQVLKNYDYLVIMGGDAHTMSKRIKCAMDLTQHGLMFKELIFLSGQRKLAGDETPAILEEIFTTILPRNGLALKNQKFPNHESALLKYLLNNTDLPQTWYQTKKTFIEAPMFQMKVVEDSITEQMKEIWAPYIPYFAVEEWLKRLPKPGSILDISDPKDVLKNHLPSLFTLETITIKAAKESLTSIFDEVTSLCEEKTIE